MPPLLGLAEPVAVAVDRDVLRLVHEAVDEGDHARGVGKVVGHSAKGSFVVSRIERPLS